MLFTRCPDCDTTFRVTDDALRKANGQVRCGRCASVFNAYAERREEPAEAIADAPQPPAIPAPPAKQAKADVAALQSVVQARPSIAVVPQPAPAEIGAPAGLAAPTPAIRLVPASPPEEPRALA